MEKRYALSGLLVIGAPERFDYSEMPRIIQAMLWNPQTDTVIRAYREEDGFVVFDDDRTGPMENFDYWVTDGSFEKFDEPFPAKPDHALYAGPDVDGFLYIPTEEIRFRFGLQPDSEVA